MHNLFHKFLFRISQKRLRQICYHFHFHELLVFSSIGKGRFICTTKKWTCTHVVDFEYRKASISCSMKPQKKDIFFAEQGGFPQKGRTELAVLLPFLLHGIGQDAIGNIINTAKKMAPYIIVLDYRQPERNLDFPCFWLTGCVERANSDAEHRVAWCHFMIHGGIEAFVRSPPLCRIPLCGGAASLVLMPSFSRCSA